MFDCQQEAEPATSSSRSQRQQPTASTRKRQQEDRAWVSSFPFSLS